MTVRVALNLATLRGAGSRQVGHGIREGLLANDLSVVHSWIPRSWPTRRYIESITRVPAGSLAKVVAENLVIRRGLRSCRANCLFSVGDTGVLRPGIPHILMVQQAYLAYPTCDLPFQIPQAFKIKLRLMATYFRMGMPSVTRFTVQTCDMQVRLSERWGIDKGRIVVIPSSVDEHVLSLRNAPVVEGKEPFICYVAAPAAHKNHAVLVPMMAALRKSFPRLRCHLTLRSQDIPEFVQLAQSRGVGDAFVYHGSLGRQRALELVRSARAVVIPSKLESFGVGYYEALALGRPLVVADRPFAREACGEAASYASPDSGQEFATAVTKVLASEADRRAMSEASRQRFSEVHISWQEIGRRYAGVMSSLI